jgi:general secretion pathway protein B
MSYILDALKKSDQQRLRGATPTLQVAQVAVAEPKRPMIIYYGLLAAVLLAAGIMIGWLHPWQPEQPPPVPTLLGAEPVAVPATLTAPSKMPGKTAQEFPAPNPARVMQPVPVASAMKANSPAPDSTVASNVSAPIPDKSIAGKRASIADPAQEQTAMPLNELPLQIQREIPAMTVQLHAYSSVPSERLVSINSIRLREGGSLMVGLKLEQVTPDGMIFSYKGYRFQRGIR